MEKVGDDFVSKDGMFKIAYVSEGVYLPMMRCGDGQDLLIIYTGVTDEFCSFEEAKEILSNY